MSKEFDKKISDMADREHMYIPASLENRVHDILEEEHVRRTHISFRRMAIPVAACILMTSITATAAVSVYRQRMESMNHEKLEEYYAQLYQSGMGADNFNRQLTDAERQRMIDLEEDYKQGMFPEKELVLLSHPDDYKKGVAYYPNTGTFFFPEEEMADEQLLEYIDFLEKRDYSLMAISAEVESGEYVLEQPQKETVFTDRDILNSDEVYQSATELTIAYQGDLGIECMAAAADGLYLGGYNKIERMEIGADKSQAFFEDFAMDCLVTCLYVDEEGTVYAGISNLTDGASLAFGKPEIYVFSKEGALLNQFTAGGSERNLVENLAKDEEGNLYVHLRIKDAGTNASILIYNGEGELLSTVQEEDYVIADYAGIGQGRDGAVYASVYEKEAKLIGLAKIDPSTGEMTEVYGNLEAEGANMPWDVVSRGVTTDFLLWGYDGIYSYNLGEEKAVRIMAPYEFECGFEGARVTILQDGRVVLVNSTENMKMTLENGTEVFVNNPDKTVFYYVPSID